MWGFITECIRDDEMAMQAELAIKLRRVIDAKLDVLADGADELNRSETSCLNAGGRLTRRGERRPLAGSLK